MKYLNYLFRIIYLEKIFLQVKLLFHLVCRCLLYLKILRTLDCFDSLWSLLQQYFYSIVYLIVYLISRLVRVTHRLPKL